MQRRVVIAGTLRLPFARSHTACAELDNLTMLSAVLRARGALLAERGSGRGLVTVCTAGGRGVAAMLER